MQYLFSLNTEHGNAFGLQVLQTSQVLVWIPAQERKAESWCLINWVCWKGRNMSGAVSIESCCSWLVAERDQESPRLPWAGTWPGEATAKKAPSGSCLPWLWDQEEELAHIPFLMACGGTGKAIGVTLVVLWENVVHTLVSYLSFETTCLRFLYEKKNLGFFCVLIRRYLGGWRELIEAYKLLKPLSNIDQIVCTHRITLRQVHSWLLLAQAQMFLMHSILPCVKGDLIVFP